MHRWTLALGLILGVPIPANCDTYVVAPDGTGDFPTIQAAVDAAGDGDIVELTDGTFMGEGNRMVDFLGKAITVRSQSGDPQLTEINPDLWGRAFLFQSGEGPASVLEGVTILNGLWDDSEGGAAIFCGPGTAPTLANCILRGNVCDLFGGAIACHGASPSISDCVFEHNHAWANGGGVYCTDGSFPEITGCYFQSNQAGYEGYGGDGGAVFATEDSYVTITDCVIWGNMAESGGGGVSASGIISGCDFGGNTAGAFGGGLSGRDVTITDCILRYNDSDWRGGAIGFLRDGAGSLRNCTLFSNGALHGSGIYCWDGASIAAENCIICFGENAEAVGCGDGASVQLACCDVYGNEGGDWVGCIGDQYGVDGNICEDPLFCAPYACPPDYSLQDCSPCAPFSPPNPECDLIGALPVGCEGTPVQESTWGALKLLFRR